MDQKVNLSKTPQCSEASVIKYEEEWRQLFFKHNIKELRKHALFGHLRASRFRSLCWFLLLDILPEDSSTWLEELSKIRKLYKNVKDNLSCDPWNNKSAIDDPLSQNDNSLWNKHFCDEELRSVIKQDVVRTFPGVDFFRKPKIQELMVSILFIYAREHPIMCYRQGMHELLAPLLFVLHCDHQTMLYTYEEAKHDDTIQEILNPEYLEEDGYNLFVALMSTMTSCYHINNVAPTSTGYFPASSTSSESPSDSKESENEVVSQLNSIRDNLLQKVDPELCEHLKKLDITLPLFGIRWLRLLFGREFPLQDLLVLWDAIFSRRQDFNFVHCVVVAMLHAIRKQLLEGDYTGCLMYLMRYPINIDISYVINFALYLHDPEAFPKPFIKTEMINLNAKKVIDKQPEVFIPNMSLVKQPVNNSSKSFNKFTNKFVPKWDSTEPNLGHETTDRLLAELKHARSIMSLSRLKLLQYHKVLIKAIPNTENNRDAMLAMDGIYELCNLLTSRYYSPHTPSEVEHAVEAGEVRPTELNLNLNLNLNTTKQVPARSKDKEKEMKIFAKSEVVHLDGVPMTDPTHSVETLIIFLFN